jgi:glycogen debranching enzyme GlgX
VSKSAAAEAAPPLPAAQLTAGRPWPLGATWDGRGVNFAVVSAHAKSLDLCLFDGEGRHELSRTPLPGRSHDVWHGYLEGAGPGLLYGYRAHGAWRPERGQRFNAHKLLLDPYAREIAGRFEWRAEHFGADPNHAHHHDPRDNGAFALKARVVDNAFDWEGDAHPHTPLADTVLYELHVKGFTKLHSQVPEALRGSYAGLAHDAAIEHLKRLGVTAVSLLPVQQHLDEQRLVRMGLANYWGYNTLGFFCAEPRLASGTGGLSPRDEFRAMVKRLHRAGIEVILDVVYNHTAESDETGPTVSFRGLDNALYYRLQSQHRSHYENPTGCGNALDLRQPRVVQLVMDSLRYWAGEMHVDGFRFDLAPVLGRTDHGFDKHAPLFAAIAQDPLLSTLKMIAEPWDIGPGGYQLGGFPPGWLEWNDRFRDTMRSFWVEHGSTRGDFAQRLCASSATFQAQGRMPAESVNYVVSHDGFTLRDLVSYSQKHNLANGENNRDGHGQSHNHNCGVEGPSDDAQVNALRGRLQRALLATALLAQGTPMLTAGDELGHTQRGNNNPYCQDNETTWIDWSRIDADLLAFTERVLALRRQALPFANRWYDGLSDGQGRHDLSWQRADGQPLQGEEWRQPQQQALACLIGKPGRLALPVLWLINGSATDTPFVLPPGPWQAQLDTAQPRGVPHQHASSDTRIVVAARCLLVLAAPGHTLLDLDEKTP